MTTLKIEITNLTPDQITELKTVLKTTLTASTAATKPLVPVALTTSTTDDTIVWGT